MNDLLTVAAQNLGRGGHRGAFGAQTDRWPLLVERLVAARADIVLLAEANDWDTTGRLDRACADLGMESPGLAPSNSGYATCVLYRPDRLALVEWNTACARETLHGFGLARFDLAGYGLPGRTLTAVPVHLSPYGFHHAAGEADIVSSRGWRGGDLAVIGGDVNYSPPDPANPDPDFAAMKPWNIGARTLEGPGGELVADRRIGRIFVRKGWIDAAWDHHNRTGDAAALRPTGGHERVDQFYLTPVAAAAIDHYAVLDTPVGASDHDGILLRLDPARFGRTPGTAWD